MGPGRVHAHQVPVPGRVAVKVIVLGGGVIGVTSAYYLARAGHEVTVVDRQAGPAQETSFANAGQISPGYAAPWAAPGVPLKALQWMFQRHAPLAIGRTVRRAAALDVADAAQLQSAALRGQQGAHAARGRIQPRLPVRSCAPKPACSTKAASGGTLQVFRTQAQLDGVGQGRGRAEAARRALRSAGPRRLRARRARDCGADRLSRRPAAAERRDRRLPPVHRELAAWRRRSACASGSTPR